MLGEWQPVCSGSIVPGPWPVITHSINVLVEMSPSVRLNSGQGLGRSVLPGLEGVPEASMERWHVLISEADSGQEEHAGDTREAGLSTAHPGAPRTSRASGSHSAWAGKLVPSRFHLSPLSLVPASGLHHFHGFSRFPDGHLTPRAVDALSLLSQKRPGWNSNPCRAGA